MFQPLAADRCVVALQALVAAVVLTACQPETTARAAMVSSPAVQQPAADQVPPAQFDWFRYQGMDAMFEPPLPAGYYQNPLLAGFFPDPSITQRRNADGSEDFYLVNSSFAYTPGLPILHSKDLVNWQLIGHAITRPSQVEMTGLSVSQGLFAPTLRYHNGLFYLINTAVGGRGNFLLTATDPAGPWSDPIWLPQIGGIDPDLFFDDDGKVYIAHNDAPPGEPLYDGHRAIWLWQYDPVAQAVLTDSRRLLVNGGVDIASRPIWIEGPHLYKHNGWYYLLCAEGGTAEGHSAVIFRSKSLSEPFVPAPHNPILTQRDLPAARGEPQISATGHADFVRLADGSWWAVFLGQRTYAARPAPLSGQPVSAVQSPQTEQAPEPTAFDQQVPASQQPSARYANTGRETFLLPVHWPADGDQQGWPEILAQGEAVPLRPQRPAALVTAGTTNASVAASTAATTTAAAANTATDTAVNTQAGVTNSAATRPSAVPAQMTAQPQTGNFSWQDDFEQPQLALHWYQLRQHRQGFVALADGLLQLQPGPDVLGSAAAPAFVASRQQHLRYEVSTALKPPAAQTSVGLVAFQNEQFHYYFGLGRDTAGEPALFLEQAAGGAATELLRQSLPGWQDAGADAQVLLKIAGDGGDIRFFYALMPAVAAAQSAVPDWQLLGGPQGSRFDGTLLSSQVAGGIVGTILGLHSRLEAGAAAQANPEAEE